MSLSIQISGNERCRASFQCARGPCQASRGDNINGMVAP
jgi:hypothetical protein